jgi:cell wall-associated NlpC family hydrolase
VQDSLAGKGSMKGRYCIILFLTSIALLFAPLGGYSKGYRSQTQSSKPTPEKPGAESAVPKDSSQTYVIRRGDTLYGIAHDFQVTVAALKSANGLKSTKIKPGRKLVIPGAKAVVSVASKKQPPKKKEHVPSPAEQAAVQYISQLQEQSQGTGNEPASTPLRLAEAGFKMLGVRYRFSGGSEKTGFDCSGLVKNLFSQFNIDLPRSSREQYEKGEKIDRDNLQVGDLVFFSSGGSRPTHVGIYVGEDKFIHAARKARKVVVTDLNKFWYTMRYLGARRIAELWSDEAGPETETRTE